MMGREEFIHKNLEILALSSSPSYSWGNSDHAARDWLRESVKGLTGRIQNPSGWEKPLRSPSPIMKFRGEQWTRRWSWLYFDFGKSKLGIPLVRERIPAPSQHTQSPDAFWCYAQKCWNILLPFPVSDLIYSVLAVSVINSQFYIRSSCNTLTNQLLHFLFYYFFPLPQSFGSVWGKPVNQKAS